jgi:hypothetical protein
MLRDIYANETVSCGPLFEWDKILLAVEHMCRKIQNPIYKHLIYQRKHKKIRNLVDSDRKLRLRMVADMVKINEGSIQEIFVEDINIRKLRTKIFPKVPTHDQKMKNVDTYAHVIGPSVVRFAPWPGHLTSRKNSPHTH